MTITFIQDESASFDGKNIRAYFKGETYTAGHAIEKMVFQMMIDKGSAVSGPPEDDKSNKTIKPKSRK
jgi:hypothetical protein